MIDFEEKTIATNRSKANKNDLFMDSATATTSSSSLNTTNTQINNITTDLNTESIQPDDDGNESFDNLFKLYDKENLGFISVERFINTTKEFMSSSWKDDDYTITQLIQILDPSNQGKINFENFVAGIKKLTDSNSSNNVANSGHENKNQNDLLLNLNDEDDEDETKHDHNKYDKSSHVSIDLMDELERKSNLSPYSNSNDTFNEYDTDSQFNSLLNKSNKTNNDLKIINSTSNSSNLTDLMYMMDEPNSLLDKSNDNNKYNGDVSYTNLSFDLLSSKNLDSTGAPQTSSLVDHNSNESDPFGFYLVDDKSTNNNKLDRSFSNNSDKMSANRFKRLSYVSTKQIANGLFSNSLHNNNPNSTSNSAFEIINDGSNSNNESSKNSTHSDNEDHLIDCYEAKIKELSNDLENLNMEKIEIFNKMGHLNSDNAHLLEKIRELEEINIDLEKKYQQKFDSQELRHNDSIAKLLKTLDDERYNHQAQLSNHEKEIHHYKEENSRYYNELNEKTKKMESIEEKLNDENEKFAKLKLDYQKLVKENDVVKVELETVRAKYKEKIDILQSDLNESQMKLQQQSIRLRGYTISINEENYLNNKVKELENELNQAKIENSQLIANNEDLKAQILKNNLDSGRLLLHMTSISGGPSLAAEIDTMSKDDLMEKYKNEQQMTKRLRDYLEVILSKIMLHSPEILEVNTNQTSSTNNTGSNGNKKLDSNNNNSKSNKSKDQSKTGAGEFFSFRKNSDSVKFQL